jgi:hypothetical protein
MKYKALISCVIALLACGCARNTGDGVAVVISSAHAWRYRSEKVKLGSNGKYLTNILVICTVTMENANREDLSVLSNYDSAFDGMFMTVSDTKGGQLVRRSILQHRTPQHRTPIEIDARIVLPIGSRDEEHWVDVPELGRAIEQIRIRLDGRLKTSEFRGSLTSNVVNVRIMDVENVPDRNRKEVTH